MTIYRVHLADDLDVFEDVEVKTPGYNYPEDAIKVFVEGRMFEIDALEFPVDVFVDGNFYSADIEMVPEIQVSDSDASDEQVEAWIAYHQKFQSTGSEPK